MLFFRSKTLRKTTVSLLVTVAAAMLAGCSEENPAVSAMQIARESEPSLPRWYDQQQVSRGNKLFQANCAVCHKPDASGTTDWRTTDANGNYPPPPLNGTAHTWHHPLSVLRRTVHRGGIPLGGTMPAFGDKLNADEIDAILAWVQSNWSDEVYNAWHGRDQQARR
jgi:mono/diheme cytochrome c family protein